ncbi:MAG TPA: SDR family NAD(P)-dependent oxidoreductase [Burkholderiales bacterium]|nr:SDR family NAD(P)-dependent oxidoreductase [Burkholderiales bacterium]
MSFGGKTCLITGAAGNLGRAVAAAFAAEGASLILMDLHEEHLRSAYGGEDKARRFAPADLRDAQSVARALPTGTRIDILCNIAGGFRMGQPVHETSDDTWDLMLDLNARSVLNCARAVVPGMLAAGGGKIINVGAMAASSGKANMAAYIASKSAVMRLTESMAAELRDKGINVNGILPSTIDTPQNRKDMPKADPKRWVTPEALADVVLFLASDAARAIHGALIPVAGLA